VITLAIDASTYEGTVAVLDGTRVLAESVAAMRGRDAERLMPAVESTLKSSGISLTSVDRIVCGSGPGSFTSLRIAGSLAKGMALGASKPLYAVSSLALIVAGNATDQGRYVAVLDAMRGDVFAAVFVFGPNGVALEGEAVLVTRGDVPEIARVHKATPVGPDMQTRWAPHARGVGRMEALLTQQGTVNLADWEPTYGRLAEAQVKLEAASR